MKILKYFIESVFIYFLFFLFKIIGLNYSRKISSFLFLRIGSFFRKKKVIKKNILNVFKKHSELQINNIITSMWTNYGYVFAEYLFLDKFRFNKFNKEHIKINGQEKLANISNKKKPTVFISGHFGNFELMAMEIEKANINLATIYRPLNNPFLNPLMVFLRKKYICKNQIKKGLSGTREIISYIKNNYSVALMVDQRVGESERCPFFNIPAHTTTIPAQVALKYKLDIVPIYLERKKDNTFLIDVLDPIKIQKTGNLEEDKKKITIKINQTVEKMVIKNPNQWIWTHSRWK